MRAPPGTTVSEYGVEDHKQLPHARHKRHLLGLTGLKQPLVEVLESRVVAAANQSRHVESFSDPSSATPDGPTASEGAGVSVEGSDAHQGREFSGSKRAQLGKFGQKRPAKHGADPWHALEQSFILLEGGVGFDGLIEVPVDAGEFFFEPADVCADTLGDGLGGAGTETVFLCGHHGDDLSPSGEDRLKLLGLLVGKSPGEGLHGLSKPGENPGVESIGFGEFAGGFGEVPTLSWVDYTDGYFRRGERGGDGTFEAATGLEHHQGDGCLLSEPAEKLIEAYLIVGDDKRLSGGQDGHVQASFGDVDAYVDFSSRTAQRFSPFPVWPNLAGASSEVSAPAQATVRAPPEVSEGRDDPSFHTVSKRELGPRRNRSVAPTPTDCRPKPKHKEDHA